MADARKMKVEVWSDVACPFCYIGKRQLDAALAQWPERDRVEVVWKSFQLAPDTKTGPARNSVQNLAEKKAWTLEQTWQAVASDTERARAVGLSFNCESTKAAKTIDAHRLEQFAASRGKGGQPRGARTRLALTPAPGVTCTPLRAIRCRGIHMRRFLRPLFAVLAVAAFGIAAAATPAPARAPGDAAYEKLASGILADFYARNPTYATALGLHQFDGKLEDYSAAAVKGETSAAASFRKELEAIDPKSLSPDNRLDREMLLHSLDARRIRNEEIRGWARNPDNYSSGITSSAFSLISRDYAPVTERLKSLIERERAMPAALMEARRNLDNPPRVYTEIAIEQLDGNQAFFATTVMEAFTDVKDPALMAEFRKANDAVIAALGDYKAWMQKDLLPRSNGSFAWGADTYRRMLLASEMIDTPLDTLLQMAEADLKKNQASFSETAKRIDATRTPLEVLESLQKDHPAPGRLLAETQAELDALGRFMTENRIVTIPEDAAPAQVKETPPFMRATTSASMDTPGPFEKGNLRGFYNMTLPDPAWNAERTEEFMRQWFYPLITNVSVHEVWPGHYLQFLYAKTYPSEARKVLGAASNSEGWAHYCEQMVIDEGFHADKPAYRLAQLQDALLRNARFIAGIRMHTQGMTYDQAVDFFEKQGYQPRPVAVSESKRGTSDALFGYYTMGKIAILKLREDYRRKMGPAFRLQDFHDQFIAMGPLPLPLVREAMLGEKGDLF